MAAAEAPSASLAAILRPNGILPSSAVPLFHLSMAAVHNWTASRGAAEEGIHSSG